MGKTTLVLFGVPGEPIVEAAKIKLESLGHTVEIQPNGDQEKVLGFCGEHYCNCTTPCRSIKYSRK